MLTGWANLSSWLRKMLDDTGNTTYEPDSRVSILLTQGSQHDLCTNYIIHITSCLETNVLDIYRKTDNVLKKKYYSNETNLEVSIGSFSSTGIKMCLIKPVDRKSLLIILDRFKITFIIPLIFCMRRRQDGDWGEVGKETAEKLWRPLS